MNIEKLSVEVLHDKIVIRRVEVEQRTKGGLILGQEVEKERETGFGQVVAVGEGKQVDGTGVIPTKSKVGDIVTFLERIPRRVQYKGEVFYILRESDVDFIVRDEDVHIGKYETTSDEEHYSKGQPLN